MINKYKYKIMSKIDKKLYLFFLLTSVYILYIITIYRGVNYGNCNK